MTPNETMAAYRRALAQDGDTVTLSRFGLAGSFGPVLARITGLRTNDLVLDLQQASRTVILLAEDVVACGFPLPFVIGQDRIGWNDSLLVIRSVDDGSRRLHNVPIAYELTVAGA